MSTTSCNISSTSPDIECRYLYYVISLTIINKIKNLLYNKSFKITDDQLKYLKIADVYNRIKMPVKEPTITANNLNIYVNVWREKKYFMLILSLYMHAYQTIISKTYYDVFMDKYYGYSKVCSSINIEYDDNEFMLYTPYKSEIESNIIKIINQYKLDMTYERKTIGLSSDLLLLKTKHNSPVYKSNIIYMFNLLHKTLIECNRDFTVINVGEYPNDKTRAHRVVLIANLVKNDLDLFFYNPHGSSYSSVFSNIKNVLDKNKIKIKNGVKTNMHYISIYIKETSCNVGFQITSEDKVGYCMLYASLWAEMVMESLNNIKRFNDINKLNNIQLNIKFDKWVGYISKIMNDLDSYIFIYNKQITNNKDKFRSLTKEEKFEIILRYSEELFNKIIHKLTPQEQKLLFDEINLDLKKENIDPVTNMKLYGKMGERLQNETNISNYINVKPERYIPDKVEDIQIFDAEKSYEHNILKNITKNFYEHRCKTHENCKYSSLYCDKLEPDDEYGQCEVKKKIKMIGSECNKDSDCVSNLCKEKMCRLDYDVNIRNKLNFIN